MNLKEYFAAQGSHFSNKDANVIGPVLDKLANENKSTRQDIVDEAKKKKSLIHNYFEWDNEKAANNYRLDQAGLMARSIVVRIKTNAGDKDIRAFHPIQVTKDNNKSYLTIDIIKSNPEYAEQVIYNAKRQLRIWKDRYNIYRETLNELEPVFEVLDKI